MKKRWMVFSLLLLAWTVWSCGTAENADSHKDHDQKKAADAAPNDLIEELKGMTMETLEKEGKLSEAPAGAIQISAEKQQLIGVKIGQAEIRRMDRVIRTVGRVDYDEKLLMTVSPKIGGWIENLNVDTTGQFVHKGQPLVEIYSPELVSTQEEYLLALRARNDLLKSIVPEVVESARSLVEATRRRLKLWDISDEQIRELEESNQPRKTLTLYSPFSGIVLEKMVFKGMYISPGMVIFKLADLSAVWVLADIYEYELPLIRLGQEAAIQLSYLPGKNYTGKAVFIYPSIDLATRTARVRFEFANPEEKLKPGMFADVQIRIDLGRRLVVPQEAVIDTGMRKVVILARGSGYFEPREIKIGEIIDDYFEVLQGLKAGERVVTSANFLIDSESKFREAVGAPAHQH